MTSCTMRNCTYIILLIISRTIHLTSYNLITLIYNCILTHFILKPVVATWFDPLGGGGGGGGGGGAPI